MGGRATSATLDESITVYEEQLETKFGRETENVFTLSLSLAAAIMMLTALMLPLPSFL